MEKIVMDIKAGSSTIMEELEPANYYYSSASTTNSTCLIGGGGDIAINNIVDSSSSNYRDWWSKLDMVAVVTGANKGIGFALVKRLAELGLRRVVLTARDEKKGIEAVESIIKKLQEQDNNYNYKDRVDFFCLDVANPASIARFASWFKKTHGFLDILVNNAAVCFNNIDQNSVHKAHTVIATNFHGPRLLIEALFPMFRRSSLSKTRILNITSRLGSLNNLTNINLRAHMEDVQHLSEDKIQAMLDLFLSDVHDHSYNINNNHRGWPRIWTDYSVSKLALNAYSKLLATRYKLEEHGLISVNCFCPGFTQTSMTQGKGTHTPDDAAAIAANLALLPPQDLPTGIFFLSSHSTTTTTITTSTITSPRPRPRLTILSNL